MAKNFTQFQLVSGSKTLATNEQGAPTGLYDVTTQADRENFVVGYAVDEPGGERRYSLESIIHLTDKNDIGLEHVENLSRAMILDDAALTGDVTAENFQVTGNFQVQGDITEMATSMTTTSAMEIDNEGTSTTLRVVQQSSTFDIAQFVDNEDAVVVVNADGVGIGSRPSQEPDILLNVVGGDAVFKSVSAVDDVMGRDIHADGAKLDTISQNADNTAFQLDKISAAPYANSRSGFDLIEGNHTADKFTKMPRLSATGPWASSQTFTQANQAEEKWKTDNGSRYVQANIHNPLVPESASLLNLQTPGNPGYLLFDNSVEKLLSIEGAADQTGAHSADINYSHIPDGPNTGDPQTTFVKMLSSERERLDEIITVDPQVVDQTRSGYANMLVAQDIVDSYNELYTDFWSTENELEYRNTIVPSASAAVQNKRKPGGGAYTQSELDTYFGTAQGHGDGLALLDAAEIDDLKCFDLTIGTSIGTVSAEELRFGIDATVNFGDEELHFVNGLLVVATDKDTV